MAGPQTFADLEDDGYSSSTGGVKAPFWTLKYDDKADGYDEAKVLAWLKDEFTGIRKANEDRFAQIQRNLQLYKMLQYLSQEARTSNRDTRENPKSKPDKLVTALLPDLCDKKVARLIKYRPAIQCVPADDEQKDKLAAKNNKKLIDHIWYVNDYQGTGERKIVAMAKRAGESYLWIDWDENRGAEHPEYVRQKQEAEKKNEKLQIPVLDDKDQPMKDAAGKPMYMAGPVLQGDVRYRIKFPFDVLLQRAGIENIEDCEYCFVIERMSVDKAKLKYPKVKEKLKKMSGLRSYDFEKMEWVDLPYHLELIHFYHRKQDGIEEGRWITFTDDALCYTDHYPFSHKDLAPDQPALPIERLTDIDLEGELHGVSFFNRTKGAANTVNNLTNMILANLSACSYPKWFVQARSVEVEHLQNGRTVCQYKGTTPPVLAQANPTPAEVYTFRTTLREEAREYSGMGPISRGEAPKGVTANVALQFLGEQEQDDRNDEVLKQGAFRRRVAIKSLGVAADKYDKDDGRKIWQANKDNQWAKGSFDATALANGFNVQVESASALPESRAVRTQTVLDLHKEFPNSISSEQALDLIGLGESEKFQDSATVSTRAAESENDEMIDGALEKLDPAEYENHLAHWRVHIRPIQGPSFRKMPPEIQTVLKDHVIATEMLMMEKAAINQAFAQELATLPLFPLLFKPKPPAVMSPSAITPGLTPSAPQEANIPQDSPLPIAPEAAVEEPAIGEEPPPVGEETVN